MEFDKKERLLLSIESAEFEGYADQLKKLKRKAEKRMRRQLREGDLSGGSLTFDLYRIIERFERYSKKKAEKLRKEASRMVKHK